MPRDLNPPLTLKQYKAVIMLARGEAVTHIAVEVGVSENCVHKWRRKPRFQEKYSEYLEKLFESALNQAQAQMTKALTWLEESYADMEGEICSAPNVSTEDKIKVANLKIKAATVLLNAALKSHELAVLKRELAKLRHLKDLVKQLMQGSGTVAPGAAFALTEECESDCSPGQDDPDSPGV